MKRNRSANVERGAKDEGVRKGESFHKEGHQARKGKRLASSLPTPLNDERTRDKIKRGTALTDNSSLDERQRVMTLRNAPSAHASGLTAKLYGVAPVLEALRAGQRPIEHITIAEGVRDTRVRELIELARAANVPVRRAPRADVERLLRAGVNHQGIVATVGAARYTNSDELLEAIAARAATVEPPLAVVLDGIEDPRNLGAILRTVECAGAHGVFIPERRAAGLTETVAKAAAGALEHVRVAHVANVVRLLERFKGLNIWTVGTSADATMNYTEWDWQLPCAIVLGGEGAGLHRLVRERCDALVRIPVSGRIESLNVSVAAGIILYEAMRQRAAFNKGREINNVAREMAFK